MLIETKYSRSANIGGHVRVELCQYCTTVLVHRASEALGGEKEHRNGGKRRFHCYQTLHSESLHCSLLYYWEIKLQTKHVKIVM